VGARAQPDRQAHYDDQEGGGVSDDPYDLRTLRIDPATFSTPHVPAKIQKRREQFIMVPVWWLERLGEAPRATGATHQVACHLLHLHWKNQGKPFKLPNGMLKYDGISRQSKWRALTDLERRGLVIVEKRRCRSPIIHIVLAGKLSHP
jgi:hypothetical protein